jgi:hypothetical protein
MDLNVGLTEELAVKWHIIRVFAAKINYFNDLCLLICRLAVSVVIFRVRVISGRL